MDTASILIGIALILLFAGPILLMIYYQSNKNNKHITRLKTLGLQHNLNLDQVEHTNSLLLGMDVKAKKIIIAEPKNDMQFEIVDLTMINSCIITKTLLPAVNGNKSGGAISHISLDLIKNKSREMVKQITFYDEDDDTSYDAATQLCMAGKWETLIREQLPVKKPVLQD